MKKTLLILTLITAKAVTSATLTVSNDLTGGAQYTNLTAAYTAANAGDTLLLEGTNIAYTITDCMPAWDKKLVVIGIGHNPNKANPRKTYITRQDCTNSAEANETVGLNSGGNGSVFIGIDFFFPVNFVATVSNYTFIDCIFEQVVTNSGISFSNVVFKNCIFGKDNDNNFIFPTNGILVSNINFISCVFDGYINGSNNLTTSSILVDHCIFLIAGNYPIQNFNNATIQNSIFMNASGITYSSTGNTFNNNIVRLSVTLPTPGNVGAANQNSVDPSFVNYNLGNYYNPAYDFHLNTGSPASLAATDGSDIGVHGSITHFSETGESLINPIIRAVNINNPTLTPNGNLNVNINATKPTDN